MAGETKTAKLMDEEVRQEAERRAKISKATLEIEAILLREDFTMGDFLEVVELFTARANTVFARTKLKKIKEDYV